jgi:hypothetical protein
VLADLLAGSLVDLVSKFLELDDLWRDALEQETLVSDLVADADVALAWEHFLNIEVLLQGALFYARCDAFLKLGLGSAAVVAAIFVEQRAHTWRLKIILSVVVERSHHLIGKHVAEICGHSSFHATISRSKLVCQLYCWPTTFFSRLFT